MAAGFDHHPRPNLSGIPTDWLPVTTSDSDDNCGDACIAIRAGTAGTVSARMARAGVTARAFSVSAGETVPGQFTRILSTGTTATGILAAQG